MIHNQESALLLKTHKARWTVVQRSTVGSSQGRSGCVEYPGGFQMRDQSGGGGQRDPSVRRDTPVPRHTVGTCFRLVFIGCALHTTVGCAQPFHVACATLQQRTEARACWLRLCGASPQTWVVCATGHRCVCGAHSRTTQSVTKKLLETLVMP